MPDLSWDWPDETERARATADGKHPRWELWAVRYETFRIQGPKRSLLAVYNAERVAAGKPPVQRTPGSWDVMAAWGRWRERAAVWDLERLLAERRERDAEEQKLRDQARASRRRVLDAGYLLLLEAMTHVRENDQVDDTSIFKLMAAIKGYVDSNRREFGELPPGFERSLEQLSQGESADDKERMLRYLDDVRRVAWLSGDLRVVMDVLKTEQLLLGLAPATKLEHSGAGGGPIQHSEVVIYLPDNGRTPVTGTDDDDDAGD